MRLKKVLPMADSVITTIPSHANFLSIAMLTQRGVEWLCNYYVNIYVKYTESNWYQSCRANFIDWGTLDRNYTDIVRSYFIPRLHIDDIIEFIKKCIEDDYYINLRLDLYYLSCSNLYQNTHFTHNVLINGIDTERKKVAVSDFFSGKKYTSCEVSFDELTKAYHSITEESISSKPDYQFFRTEVQLLKNHDSGFQFSLSHLIHLLMDYRDGKDSTGRFFNSSYLFDSYDMNHQTEYVYGIEAINKIALLFCEGKLGISNMHLLYDRYKAMVYRLHFLSQKYEVDFTEELSAYVDLEQLSLRMRNLCLKNLTTGHKELQSRIISGYHNMYMSEKEVLNQLIGKLEKISSVS